MNLQELLNDLPVQYTVTGNNAAAIKSLSLSSKDINPGGCFFAIRGTHTDGHKFIADAIGNGAVCIVCEQIPSSVEDTSVTYVVVPDTRLVVGPMASSFYGHPSKKMKVIGITGTNGKTTVATMIYQMLNGFFRKAGLISTVENIIGTEVIESTHTTPDPITIQELLKKMHDAGCEYVSMEVSSHSVVQSRILGIQFTGAVFTNLSHDHLDYHHTIENYAAAKKSFFDILPKDSFALTNIDDVYGRFMVADCSAHMWTYGFNGIADFNEVFNSKLIGRFNEYNMLAVYAVGKLLGFEPANIKNILKDIPAPRGRFELAYEYGGIKCIVDFAHTPDGIQNVLEAARDLVKEGGRLIAVLGCGGDRDGSKRAMMGRLGYDLADILILTSDNPRSEDPLKILSDIRQGLPEEIEKQVESIVDRHEAINRSKDLAHAGDVVMVLGKGHETYQEIKGVKNHFDDKEEILQAFGA